MDTTRVQVQAQYLQPGDVVSFDRRIISVQTQGTKVPSGKCFVTYERSNGVRSVATWNKTTKITARRPLRCKSTQSAATPASEQPNS